jgi:hypothetical protein
MNGMQSGGSSRKVIGGLVVVIGIGFVLAVVSSGTNPLSFLPFLLILACPLMMIFMMSSMGHNHGHNHLSESASERQPSGISEDVPDLRGLARDQQVWALRHALTRIAWRQEALRQTLDQVEADQRAERVVDAEPTATSPTSR